MSESCHRPVLDTLLPGDGDVPTATAAGIDSEKISALLTPIAAAAARIAGSEQAFTGADEARRTEILTSVQKEMPDAFAALIAALLPDYYELPAVLKAFGWPVRPPQPQGHAIPQMDGPTAERLEKVKLRGKLWRDEA